MADSWQTICERLERKDKEIQRRILALPGSQRENRARYMPDPDRQLTNGRQSSSGSVGGLLLRDG